MKSTLSMSASMTTVSRQILCRIGLAILLWPISTSAQTAPQIGYLFPAGAQRGTSVKVDLFAKYMPGPCGVWIDGTGLKSRSQVTTGSLDLQIAEEAKLGDRHLRIFSVQGGSQPRQFVVGEFPEVIEHPNENAQPLKFPTTVNGQMNPAGDIDRFELKLQAGQQVVCAVAARSIGSVADTTLRLLDSTGRIVALANDHHGLDPLLTYRCAKSGNYSLQIYNFDLSGRPEHVYRLTVTTGAYVNYAFPAGVQAGAKSAVMLYGWNLKDGNSQAYTPTTNAANTSHVIALPGCANRPTLAVDEAPEVVEVEPNNTAESAQVIAIPATVNGKFSARGDVDTFGFTAKKGQQIRIEVAAATLGFATDAVLTISNDKGKLLKTVDDAGSRDPSLLFTATADGDYLLTLSERAGRGNDQMIYRLKLFEPKPDLKLTVKTSEYAVESGESLEIPVTLTKLDGFAEELEITAIDLPKGVTVEAQKLPAKTPKAVKLKLTAAKGLPFPASAIRIVARTKLNGKPVERFAHAAITVVPGAAPIRTSRLWLAVRPHIPFSLTTTTVILEANRMSAFRFPVQVTREEGFSSPIRLVGVDPDRRGTVVPLDGRINGSEAQGSIPLIIQKQAIEGTTHRSRVMGVIEVAGPGGKMYPIFHVAKGSMAMGCQPNLLTLAVTPDQTEWQAGKTIQVTVTAVRRTKMGEVIIKAIVPDSLPGITATPLKLSSDQLHATFEIKIDKAAKLPPRGTIQLRAESARQGLPIYAAAPLSLVAP